MRSLCAKLSVSKPTSSSQQTYLQSAPTISMNSTKMFRPDNLEERPIEQPPHEIRIYEALRTVKPIFMNLLREHKQWKIDFVHPRDHNLLPPLKEYNGDPLNLTVHCASPDECLASGWDPQFWALEHETQEALLSRNQCDGFCFVFLLAVTRMLSGTSTSRR
jgi:hypothetical protein